MGSDQSDDQTAKGTPEAGQGGDGERAPRPGRRRPTLVAAAVAAAVLLAGGGGAYLASGGGGDGANASGEGDPKPLPLDGYGLPDEDGAVAPGEPDPNGTGPVFRTTGPLPDGPDAAKVHYAKGPVSSADVAALAKALDVKGTPKLSDGAWWVGGGPESGSPSLRVTRKAPGDWTFSGSGSTVGCDAPGKATEKDPPPDAPVCAPADATTSSDGADGSRGGDPVSEAEAKREAEPVLKAVGLGDVSPDASLTVGGLRTVTAEPDVSGLPTLGWTTSVQIGEDGPVSAHGMLADLAPGAEYPVVSAAKALRSLQDGPRPATRDIAPCLPKGPKGPKASAEPVLPADPERTKPDTDGNGKGDGDKPRIAPCLPTKVVPQEVRKAEFGLSSQSVDGTSALVPSWLFTVGPAGSDDTRVMAEVAVDPTYIEQPEKPGKPGSGEPESGKPDEPASPGVPATTEVNVESYTVDGRTLTVRFWGGVCSVYSVRTDESGGTVKVEVTGKEKKPGQVCILVAKQFTEKVQLDEALGDRKVVDAATGESVPKKK